MNLRVTRFPETLDRFLVRLILLLLAWVIVYFDVFMHLQSEWLRREEYGHGFFLPLISFWLLWHRRSAIAEASTSPSALGPAIIALSAMLLLAGNLSALNVLSNISAVTFLFGLAATVGGIGAMKVCSLPLGFLFFAIPMPYFVDAQLSWWLQLVSSSLGVDILRVLGISVYLQGNVIDLGIYALQIVDACSGLRYLYPLSSLAFLAAYLFRAPLWMRVLIFCSVLPITVVMNSIRIAIIGWIVDYSGVNAADGFLHAFEGWLIFLACAVLLLFEIWLLDRLYQQRSFGLLLALPRHYNYRPSKKVGESGYAVFSLSVLAVAFTLLANDLYVPQDIIPSRKQFSSYPLKIQSWHGQEDFLAQATKVELGSSDYILADYENGRGDKINFYAAYYEQQKKGVSPHSPRVCIPGGGWAITDFTRLILTDEFATKYPVNRAVLELNTQRQLVYYWFEQRGRRIANEYVMKWYLLADSISMHRSDGALLRVSTVIDPNESVAAADQRLQSFVLLNASITPDFIPK